MIDICYGVVLYHSLDTQYNLGVSLSPFEIPIKRI